MPSLQRAKATQLANYGVSFESVELPKQKRDTRVVRDLSTDEIANEIVAWIKEV